MNFPVTLVIPIFNEAKFLPELLLAIHSQSYRPNEIIFCDAGSSDNSTELIQNWWQDQGWEDASCTVLSRPGAMPGAGRNAGLCVARNDWIAFLDGGITPDNCWLGELCRYVDSTKVPAVFGLCHFSAQTAFAKAICALSYGNGSQHPVVPASLISLKVFKVIGCFPEHLRAGEDLVWVDRFIAHYGPREVNPMARVRYTHFPLGWKQAFNKWRITELNCVLAGVRRFQQLIYFFGLPALYLFLFLGGYLGILLFASYILIRGVFDPMRRSADKIWWGNKPCALIIAPFLALVLDIAKWLGLTQGTLMRLKTTISTREK